ncbi:hypothetical protein ABZ832_17130 [Streptantibioticus parmotrematis]|uniref:hypothetical protein n=1 Tax=Streptantibioticus parmotrematis TaxID=2873249 RepID=UPI0033FA4243
MSELGIALIAAASAVAGSAVTGWYTRNAGVQQAEAARHAGDRQADALLETVRMTMREEERVRVLAQRRQIYVRFVQAAEARTLCERTGQGDNDIDAVLQRAFGEVVMEGPTEVAAAARHFIEALRRHGDLGDLEAAKAAFVSAAQGAVRLTSSEDESRRPPANE